MAGNCFLTIIIPIFNCCDKLPENMERLLRVEAKDIEILLIDDGSTDGTGALCDALAEDARVRVLHQANAGAAAARNAGLAAATAEYVTFLDADDVLLSGALAALTEAIGTADAAQGRIVREDPETYHEKCVLLNGREALAAALRDPTRHLLCHGWLFRRALLTERFDEALTLGEDAEWMLRTLRHAGEAVFTQTPVYRYTLRRDSALRSHTGASEAYLRMLGRAEANLALLDMPQETALFRLSHLLLMLTHDDSADAGSLRESAPFAADFARVRLRGLAPRMLTLRLLRQRRYVLVRGIVRLRRWMNRMAAV